MLAMGVFGEDGSHTLIPTLMSSPLTVSSLLCLLCLVLATALIFPLLFALKWDDAALMPWNNVFVPVWIVFAVAYLLSFLLLPAVWTLRVLIWLRLGAVLAFFVCLNVALNALEAAAAAAAVASAASPFSGWGVFGGLIVHEGLTFVTNGLVQGVSLTVFRAERDGSPRSHLGLGYVGFLLRRFLTPALRLAVWCTMAHASDELVGLQRPLLPLGILVGWLMLIGTLDTYNKHQMPVLDDESAETRPSRSFAISQAIRTLCNAICLALVLMIWAGLYLTFMDERVKTLFSGSEPAEPWTAVVSFTTIWIASLLLLVFGCLACLCGSCAMCIETGAMADESDMLPRDEAEQPAADDEGPSEPVADANGFKSAGATPREQSEAREESTSDEEPEAEEQVKKPNNYDDLD
jgi:hypothetical protein